jgi:hypothetical protein
MPFNIYGGKAVEETVTGGAGKIRESAQARARKFFGSSVQSEYALAQRGQVSWDLLQRSMATFGTQAIIEGDAFLDKAMKQMDVELATIRKQAIESRANADLESYQALLRRKAQIAGMRTDANAMKAAGIGQFITGVGMAVATLTGTWLGGGFAKGAVDQISGYEKGLTFAQGPGGF